MTHSFSHSFTTDLLLGYACLAVLFLLRRPLTALLAPRARALCLRAVAPFSHASEWALAAPAIVLGVWTHLLWDSFTHANGWIVHRLPVLSAPLVLGAHQWTVYHALQYASSVVGLCVLVLWYDRLPRPRIARGPDAARSAAGPVLVLVLAAAVLIGGVQAIEGFRHTHSIDHSLSVLLIVTISWFAALYLTAGVVLALEHASEPPQASQ